MSPQSLKQALQNFKAGKISEDQLLALLKELPYQDLGFAKVDHHRSLRHGLPEVIFGKGKSTEQIIAIAEALISRNPNILKGQQRKFLMRWVLRTSGPARER